MCIFLRSFRWWYSFFSQVIENRLKTMLFWRTLFFKKSKIFKKPRFWPFLRDFFEKIFLPSERSEKNTHFKKKDRPSSYSKKSFSEPIFRGAQAKNGFLHKKCIEVGGPPDINEFFSCKKYVIYRHLIFPDVGVIEMAWPEPVFTHIALNVPMDNIRWFKIIQCL